MSLLGGTYGSREREISSNDVKRGDDCLKAAITNRGKPASDHFRDHLEVDWVGQHFGVFILYVIWLVRSPSRDYKTQPGGATG